MGVGNGFDNVWGAGEVLRGVKNWHPRTYRIQEKSILCHFPTPEMWVGGHELIN